MIPDRFQIIRRNEQKQEMTRRGKNFQKLHRMLAIEEPGAAATIPKCRG
jgi:hypothetical protein